MRISLIIGTLAVGGTERQVTRLASELRATGHDVEVLCIHKGGPLSSELERAGVPWTAFGWNGFRSRGDDGRRRVSVAFAEIRKIFALARHLRRRRPDVCHTFLFWANALGIPAAFIAGVSVRVSGRRSLVSTQGGPASPAARWLTTRVANRLSRAIVANSQVVAADVIRVEHVPPAKVRVVANGVDIPRLSSDPGVDPPTGVMVANFRVGKGHSDLVRALSVIDHSPKVKLVGAGDERAHVEDLARELGVADRVEFIGPVDDPASAYQHAQFALLPSLSEGLPNAVLEAMAFGLPVIATAVGGTVELVDDGVTGLLVPPARPDLLAAAIERLAGDAELRVRLGAAGRRRAASFPWSACREAHLVLYASLAGSGNPPVSTVGFNDR